MRYLRKICWKTSRNRRFSGIVTEDWPLLLPEVAGLHPRDAVFFPENLAVAT
jgi:hypothetical protein